MTYLGDPTQDIARLVNEGGLNRTHGVNSVFGPQAGLLILLYKLRIVGIRRVSQSYGQMLMTNNLSPPPCSIPLAIVSLSRDYIQFCPKRMADKDLDFAI